MYTGVLIINYESPFWSNLSFYTKCIQITFMVVSDAGSHFKIPGGLDRTSRFFFKIPGGLDRTSRFFFKIPGGPDWTGCHASGCKFNSWSGQNFFLVEVVANLSLHLKQLELGQEVLKYSNPDRIMLLSGPSENWKWDLVRTSRHCLHLYHLPKFRAKLQL